MTPLFLPKSLVPVFLGLMAVASGLCLWRIYGPDPAAELRGPRLREAHRLAIVAPPPPGVSSCARAPQAGFDDYRVIPALRGGAVVGYRLYALRPGSPLARRGFENGDLIARINGLPIDTPERAHLALDWLRGTRHARVDVERRGAPLQVVYDVVER